MSWEGVVNRIQLITYKDSYLNGNSPCSLVSRVFSASFLKLDLKNAHGALQAEKHALDKRLEEYSPMRSLLQGSSPF